MSESLMPEVGADSLRRYLLRKGWTKADHPNANIELYNLKLPDEQNASIVLPVNSRLADAASLIDNAVAIISDITGTTPDGLAREIEDGVIDILKFKSYRIGGGADLLPLNVASDWIAGVKQLLASTAYTEVDPRPAFVKAGSAASDFVRHCRFGHTFKGSFGITVESPVSTDHGNKKFSESESPPFERRVIERLARGLMALGEAVAKDSIDDLINSYSIGLNANMCRALNDTYEALDGRRVDYGFIWDARIPASKEVASFTCFTYDGRAHEFTREAASRLESTEEMGPHKITGKIYQLRDSIGNSIDLGNVADDERSAHISCSVDIEFCRKIRVCLSQSDYAVACDAHRDGRLVSVIGIPVKSGRTWQLVNPSDFRIVTS